MLILIKKLRKFSENSDFREKLGTIKRPMKNFQGFELENIIDELGNTMFPTWRPNEPVILNVFDFGLQFNSNLSFLMLLIPWLLTFFQILGHGNLLIFQKLKLGNISALENKHYFGCFQVDISNLVSINISKLVKF